MNIKVCSKCGYKGDPDADFYKRHRKCKECCKKASTKWNKDHPEKVKVYIDKYQRENHEKIKAYGVKRRIENPEKVNAINDKHYNSLCGGNTAIINLPRLPPEYEAFIDDNGFLNVKCYHCKEYYIPTNLEVKHCINGFNKGTAGQSSIYCKQQCKDDCPVYNFKPRSIDPRSLLYDETFDPRELQGAWATAVKERDGYQCTKCDNPDNLPLHAHHIDPLALDYDAWELDNGITFCLDCHMEAHQEKGCSYSEIKEKKANCDL